MAKGDRTSMWILTLTINEKQCEMCNTVKYNREVDQSAASIRVDLMIILLITFTGIVTIQYQAK